MIEKRIVDNDQETRAAQKIWGVKATKDARATEDALAAEQVKLQMMQVQQQISNPIPNPRQESPKRRVIVLNAIKDVSSFEENNSHLNIRGRVTGSKAFIKTFKACHRAIKWTEESNGD